MKPGLMATGIDTRLRSATLMVFDAPVTRIGSLEYLVRSHHRHRRRYTVRHVYLKGVATTGQTVWAGPFPERLSQSSSLSRLDVEVARLVRGDAATPGSAALDLLLCTLGEPVRSGADRGNWYASALGMRDPVAIGRLDEAFAAGFSTVKVDVAPSTGLEQTRAIADIARHGGIAVDVQSRFDSIPNAIAALAELEAAWLEDPCPIDEFEARQAASAPVRIVIGETCTDMQHLRRLALVPNVRVQLEVERLGFTNTVRMLEWLAARSLRCLLHGRMPLICKVLASRYPEVVEGAEVHLAWTCERLCSLAVFEESGMNGPRFLRNAAPMLDMTPSASASVVFTRPLGDT